MKTYLLGAAGVIFLSVIITLLMPEGKLKKTVSFVMRMACILVLIQPVTGIFGISAPTSSEPMYDYNYINKVYSDNQSQKLEELLQNEYSLECTCFVNVVHNDGKFIADGVTVEVEDENEKIIEDIYAYLQDLGYINITVYAKSN